MPYFLVLLHPVAGAEEEPPEHEPFIDWLDSLSLVVLGAELDAPALGAEVAYVLSCGSLADAQELVVSDPLVSSGYMRADVVEWQVVGLNPAAVEPGLLSRPSGA